MNTRELTVSDPTNLAPVQSSGGQMRVLDESEVLEVSGGRRWRFGTGGGGIFGTASFGAAARFAGGLGLLYSSFRVGYAIGTWGYNAYNSSRHGK